MNRRQFFGSLSACLAVASAPQIFVPKLEPVRWKPVRKAVWVLNPEWVKAKHEICLMYGGVVRHGELYPLRFNEYEEGGTMPIVIYPFIKK